LTGNIQCVPTPYLGVGQLLETVLTTETGFGLTDETGKPLTVSGRPTFKRRITVQQHNLMTGEDGANLTTEANIPIQTDGPVTIL
jgi:hypothetical protein